MESTCNVVYEIDGLPDSEAPFARDEDDAHALGFEALRLADAFRARVVDASTDSFVFELTGKPDKIDQFISLMVPLGLVEVSRTGVAAISRGLEAMKI